MPKKKKQKLPPVQKPRLNIAVATEFRQDLINNGIREPQIDILMVHAAEETAGFTKYLAIENNNFGGVKYQKGLSKVATPSTDYFAPFIEDKKKTPYAHFVSMNAFAKNWVPYSNLTKMVHENDIGAPIEASDLADYAHRLALNHYYTSAEVDYLAGMKSLDRSIKTELPNIGMQLAVVGLLDDMQGYESKMLEPLSREDTIIFDSQKTWPINSTNRNGLVPGLMKTDTLTHLPEWMLIDTGQDRKTTQPKHAAEKSSDSNSGAKARANTIERLISLSRTNEYVQMMGAAQAMNNITNDYRMGNVWNRGVQNSFLNNAYSPPLSTFGNFRTGKGIVSFAPGALLDNSKINQFGAVSQKYTFPVTGEGLMFASPGNKEWEDGDSGSKMFVSHFANTGTKRGKADPYKTDGINTPGNNRGDVNIYLNTPMIGNFTISTKDASSGLTNLKTQVEEVLLEILNSANAVH